jgi:hypothetical protein
MNVLEPWVLLRLLLAAIVPALFLRASITCIKVIRRFDVVRASEGQLLLEKNMQLATVLVRAALFIQTLSILFSFLVADRLYPQIQGAMCGYGVLAATDYGFLSLFVTLALAIASGALSQLFDFDACLPDLRLSKRLAFATLLITPLALLDAVLIGLHLSALDLSVLTSCCSVEIGETVKQISGAESTLRGMVWGAPLLLSLTAASTFVVSRSPSRFKARMLSLLSLITFPVAAMFFVTVTAPHVFEVPQHRCPFCLFRADAFWIGYPLLLASVAGCSIALGAGLTSFLGRDREGERLWRTIVPKRLRLAALCWAIALAVGTFPVVRYAMVSGGTVLNH